MESPDAKEIDPHGFQIHSTSASVNLDISLHTFDSFFLNLSKEKISLKNMLFYTVSFGNIRINVKAALFLFITHMHGRSSEKLHSRSSFLSE